jgi:hypothetical protein
VEAVQPLIHPRAAGEGKAGRLNVSEPLIHLVDVSPG